MRLNLSEQESVIMEEFKLGWAARAERVIIYFLNTFDGIYLEFNLVKCIQSALKYIIQCCISQET